MLNVQGVTDSEAMPEFLSDQLENTSCSEIFDRLKNRLVPAGVTSESFGQLCSKIFGEKIEAPSDGIIQISSLAFSRFDENSDGVLDEKEFQKCFSNWIEVILRPKNCLVIVDVQNDFITGSLALKNCPGEQDGAEVVPIINGILSDFPDSFQAIVYSQDWHPANHCSFAENIKFQELDPNSQVSRDDAKAFDIVIIKGNPPFEQPLFPSHCIQDSVGAEFHPDLKVLPDGLFIRKGKSPNVDSFSVFMDNQKKTKTELDELLTSMRITDVYVCGLAVDYCVGNSALDALELGYRTVVIRDACRGCDTDLIAVMESRIAEKSGVFVDTAELASMLNGSTRLLGLASQGLSDSVLRRHRSAEFGSKIQ